MRLRAVLGLIGLLLLAGCGEDRPPAATAGLVEPRPERSRTTIIVGSKGFTESRILAEVYAQGLRRAGYDARVRLDVGDEQASLAALRSGTIDAYPEYTATALTAFFDVPLADVPRALPAAAAQVRAAYRRIGLTAFPPAPLNDTQALGLRASLARRLGVRTISDLRRHAERLTLAGAPECRRRADCLAGLERAYGLRFARFAPVDPGERYRALRRGDADVAVMFTTDGELARGGYAVLRDDRGLFPPYHPMLVVRDETARRAGPGLATVIETLQRDLTTPVMRGLNAGVDIDRRSPRRMATEHLEAYGLLDGAGG